MLRCNSFHLQKVLIFLIVIVSLIAAASHAHAQNNQLLDSAKNVFRAQPEKAILILKQVKELAVKTKDHQSLIEADIIAGNIAYFKVNHYDALAIYIESLKVA